MTSSTRPPPFLALLSLVAMAVAVLVPLGCRSPDELAEDISAVVIVTDIDEDQLVELEVDGTTLSQAPKATDNIVAFSLRLEAGSYDGAIQVFEVEEEDDGERLKAESCGGFRLVIPEDADDVVTVAVDTDDFEDCPEDDDEGALTADGEDDGSPDDGSADDGSADDGSADDGSADDSADDGVP